MNYLAHAYRYLDQPMFVAGTALPDWMNIVNRKNRARRQYAEPVTSHPDPNIAQFAAGVIQHHDDDHWFHSQESFVQLSSRFAVQLREHLEAGLGHQAAFVGHISIELLLDAYLIERDRRLLDGYYQVLDGLDTQLAQTAANTILREPEERLLVLIPRFSQERFLADYIDDKRLLYRLGGIMRRVGLPALPDISSWLKEARGVVYRQADTLLPTSPTAQRN